MSANPSIGGFAANADIATGNTQFLALGPIPPGKLIGHLDILVHNRDILGALDLALSIGPNPDPGPAALRAGRSLIQTGQSTDLFGLPRLILTIAALGGSLALTIPIGQSTGSDTLWVHAGLRAVVSASISTHIALHMLQQLPPTIKVQPSTA